MSLLFFFFNDTATTEIYTLSLHDALPISLWVMALWNRPLAPGIARSVLTFPARSEEHTSELQSHLNLVCRLLLEKKKPIERRTYHLHPRLLPYFWDFPTHAIALETPTPAR